MSYAKINRFYPGVGQLAFSRSVVNEFSSSEAEPFEDGSQGSGTEISEKLSFENIPLFDPVALRLYLSQIDMSRFGFRSDLDSADNYSSASRFPPSPGHQYDDSQSEDEFPLESPSLVGRGTSPHKMSCRSAGPKPPYRGRHGTNPKCASCKTTKTPYWRDSWNQGFILCNACGLRYSKFKRRCGGCNYVPRKEDKGGKHCSQCGGGWIQ